MRCSRIRAIESLCLGQLKREQKGHESLLSSVVKISLQATPLAVSGVDQARPRLPQLVELSSQLNLKIGILEGQPPGDRSPVGAVPNLALDAPGCGRNQPGDCHPKHRGIQLPGSMAGIGGHWLQADNRTSAIARA